MKKSKIFSVIAIVIFIIGVILISCSKDEQRELNEVRLKASCGTCNWYGTSYPVCCNTSSGWGWENNASCIAKATCTGSGQTCSSCTSSSSSSSGCGTCGSYPYCCNVTSGDWGWENNKSCITKGSYAATQNCGGSSSSSSSSSGGSGSCPSSVSCPSGVSCGCYTVSGLGSNKSAYRSAGASQYFIASAMMETEKIDPSTYSYGDGKTGDSFNAGACKMSWYAARNAYYKSTSTGSYSTMAECNSNKSKDVTVWNAIKSYYGSKYWAVHRNGQTGYNNPNTNDISGFKSANDWTNNQIGSHLTDNVRFWCNIPSI